MVLGNSQDSAHLMARKYKPPQNWRLASMEQIQMEYPGSVITLSGPCQQPWCLMGDGIWRKLLTSYYLIWSLVSTVMYVTSSEHSWSASQDIPNISYATDDALIVVEPTSRQPSKPSIPALCIRCRVSMLRNLSTFAAEDLYAYVQTNWK